jgi:hypothetical protein
LFGFWSFYNTVDPLGLTGIGIISWVGYAPTRMDQMLMMSPSVSMDQLGMTDDLRNYNEKIVAAAKAREQARETKQHASTQAWTGESPFSSGSSVCNLFPTEVPSANEVYGVGGGNSDGGNPDPQSGGEKKSDDVHSGFPGDGRIHVVNDYKGDVYFKPEGDLNLNEFEFKNDGAYKIGTKSWIPLDGVNVNGKVYKIGDGYDSIHITETGEVKVLYLLPIPQFINWIRGGEKATPPDASWNNLFNVNKR